MCKDSTNYSSFKMFLDFFFVFFNLYICKKRKNMKNIKNFNGFLNETHGVPSRSNNVLPEEIKKRIKKHEYSNYDCDIYLDSKLVGRWIEKADSIDNYSVTDKKLEEELYDLLDTIPPYTLTMGNNSMDIKWTLLSLVAELDTVK